MDDTGPVDLSSITNLLAGTGLGAASGLNAWIPLLGLGVAERLGVVTLVEPLDRLGSTPVLVALGVVFLVDLVGDKIVVVDHVLHAVGTVVAPISGAVVFAAQENLLSDVHPLLAMGAGAALGEGAHVLRSAARPVVSAGSAGVGNPIVSAVEDAISVALTVLAVIVPVLAFLAVAAMAVIVVVAVRRWRRRGGDRAAAAAARRNARRRGRLST